MTSKHSKGFTPAIIEIGLNAKAWMRRKACAGGGRRVRWLWYHSSGGDCSLEPARGLWRQLLPKPYSWWVFILEHLSGLGWKQWPGSGCKEAEHGSWCLDRQDAALRLGLGRGRLSSRRPGCTENTADAFALSKDHRFVLITTFPFYGV